MNKTPYDPKHILMIMQLIEQFGDDVLIKNIAKYAEDEYMIPFNEAVSIIVELA